MRARGCVCVGGWGGGVVGDSAPRQHGAAKSQRSSPEATPSSGQTLAVRSPVLFGVSAQAPATTTMSRRAGHVLDHDSGRRRPSFAVSHPG